MSDQPKTLEEAAAATTARLMAAEEPAAPVAQEAPEVAPPVVNEPPANPWASLPDSEAIVKDIVRGKEVVYDLRKPEDRSRMQVNARRGFSVDELVAEAKREKEAAQKMKEEAERTRSAPPSEHDEFGLEKPAAANTEVASLRAEVEAMKAQRAGERMRGEFDKWATGDNAFAQDPFWQDTIIAKLGEGLKRGERLTFQQALDEAIADRPSLAKFRDVMRAPAAAEPTAPAAPAAKKPAVPAMAKTGGAGATTVQKKEIKTYDDARAAVLARLSA